MSEELLSALLDGECTPGELKHLLHSLDDNPALTQRWSRMCLVREAMEGTRVRGLAKGAAPDFCSGVMAAIGREPAAAPKPATVVAMPVRQRAANAPRWQTFAGLAAAASIAAVAAVGGYRWINQPVGAPNGVANAPAASSAQLASVQPEVIAAEPQGRLVQVSTTAAAAGDEPVETRWSQLDADTARQLGEYMMEHSNMRAEQGMGSALSYPRMMLHTAEYRSGERH